MLQVFRRCADRFDGSPLLRAAWNARVELRHDVLQGMKILCRPAAGRADGQGCQILFAGGGEETSRPICERFGKPDECILAVLAALQQVFEDLNFCRKSRNVGVRQG
ncbi:hypothetical protein J2W50_000708 [Herbaspirillum frisingense]|uniref:Uncharacterized protein n=1 Tax=Herbaspirillum frisingense TaxID=92645 RepID=A0ABU1P9E5_9BURK|nr:hypothetical protein [Herbaspirillum frisingense]